MRIGRVSKIMPLLALFALLVATLAFVLASPSVANAETVLVAGTITETDPGTCSAPVVRGAVARFQCVGLEETWAGGLSGIGVFDDAISLNVVSGEVNVSGTESFTGCVGASCGALEWAYEAHGKLDLSAFAILFLRGVEHLTEGTADLEGARGAIKFSLIGEGPATYEGSVVLE